MGEKNLEIAGRPDPTETKPKEKKEIDPALARKIGQTAIKGGK